MLWKFITYRIPHFPTPNHITAANEVVILDIVYRYTHTHTHKDPTHTGPHTDTQTHTKRERERDTHDGTYDLFPGQRHKTLAYNYRT